jgi:hypothetical protein
MVAPLVHLGLFDPFISNFPTIGCAQWLPVFGVDAS